ncbi:MAG: M48 family metallopeptidase [Planctomycetota bacterium]|nr:M48 family metallopeptidase [Planctomycetota bacterium]
MATETFHTLIARNRRNSVILIFVFLALFAGVGLMIGLAWGRGNSTFGVTVAAGAAAVAFVLTMVSYYGGSSILLGMSSARQITHDDDPQFFNVVEAICLAGGIPMPKIYLIADSAMNAFATGRNAQHASVAITTGLRSRLKRDQLQGVMAHELSHVRHNDILYAMLVSVMVGVLVMLCDVFLRSTFWGRSGSRRRDDREGGGAFQIVLIVLAVLLAIIAPMLAKIIQLSISRQREYLADAGSVELTRNPEGLIGALAALSADTEVLEVANRATAPLFIVHPIKKFEDRSSSIFDTHPSIPDRISRLRSLEG